MFTVQAQPVYRLPFASSGNVIELAIANESAMGISDCEVRIENAPAWLPFAQREQKISSLGAGEEGLAAFTFSVDKSAPVGAEQTVSFMVSNSKGESWRKEFRVVVTAPETFELFQNYPNPFNPTTSFGFQIANFGMVTLVIYDMLGREVAMLVNEELPPGSHNVVWDASNYPSGVYFYSLQAGSFLETRKMVLIK
jgi:hypothetical protein